MIRLDQFAENIVHLRFDKQHRMNAAMARMQEHYEHPNLKGKIFTFQELIESFVNDEGEFGYLNQVYAMNMPGETLLPFIEGKFNPLSDFEKSVLDILVSANAEKGYVIATFRDHEFKHELSHAMFHRIPEYRKSALQIIKKMSSQDKNRMADHLSYLDYNPSVWNDETVSHLLDQFIPCPQADQIEDLFRDYMSKITVSNGKSNGSNGSHRANGNGKKNGKH